MMKKLLMSSVFSAGLKVASAGLTFLMFMWLARALGPTEYGRFASMFALGTIGAVTALLGQHTLGIKTLSALGDAPSNAAARRGILWRGYGTVAAGGAICVAGLLAVLYLDALLDLGVDGATLVGAASFVLPFALAELVSHQFRAFGAIGWALVPRDVVWRGGVALLGLGAAIWPAVFDTALITMITISVALFAVVLFQAVAMRLKHRALLAGEGRAPSPPDMRSAFWMWIATIGTMGANLNIVAAAPFLPAEQIGAYFAAQKIAQLLQLPVLAVNIVASPIFARLHSQRDTGELRAIGRKLALLLVGPLAAGTLVVVTFAPELLGLFDPYFAVASAAMILLAAGYLITGLGGPVRQLMLMADGERDVVRLTLLSEAGGLAMVPLLVPSFGIMGAAFAALTARTIFTVAAVMWCRGRLGVDASVLSLVRRD